MRYISTRNTYLTYMSILSAIFQTLGGKKFPFGSFSDGHLFHGGPKYHILCDTCDSKSIKPDIVSSQIIPQCILLATAPSARYFIVMRRNNVKVVQ